MSFEKRRGMHPTVIKAVVELQGLRVDLVGTTVAADINADVSGIKEEDTLVSAINHGGTGVLTVVDIATLTIADGFARGSAVFATVIATDEITINGLSYVGVNGVKSDNTEWIADSTDAAAVADIVDSINTRDGANVTAVANGTTLEITAVSEGATIGNAITFVSADTTITETGSGTLINGTGVKATGTLTISSVLAGETVVVDGLTYTAVAAGTTAKFDEFEVGGTDTISATNLAEAINGREARPGRGDNIVATSAVAVVTITAVFFGTGSNSVTLTGSANITASGSGTLSGGVATGGAIRAASAFDKLMLTWFNKQ